MNAQPSQTPSLADDAAFATWINDARAQVEQALDTFLAPAALPAATVALAEAMRYGVLGAGKRLRALLVLGACQAVQMAVRADALHAPPQSAAHDAMAVRAACAVELIHAYSLIHDDMPCMDNDVLRRGKPTVHVQFGQALALLAGDAMQALAFELLTPPLEAAQPVQAAGQAVVQAQLCRLLARAAGPSGMAGGQAIDLAHVGQAMQREQLQQMHELKTGALLHASVMMGAACGYGTTAASRHADVALLQALSTYGHALGLAFQVVDDVLDATADSATLGKTAGKDAADNKPTYVSLMGVQQARAFAQDLHAQACAALQAHAPLAASPLRALADRVVQRAH